MYTFIECSIRGISQIYKRLARANNNKCRHFDPLKPRTHMIYLDANNLYGWVMSQYLPTQHFRWLSRAEINDNTINQLANNAEDGYIVEVDLLYTELLHSQHNDYPLAPERLNIDETMLSNFKQKFPTHQKKVSTKLTPNLRNKENYVDHYRNWKFYLQQGLVITKIHRVLTFKQSPRLKTYIDFNTQSAFGKDFYRLLKNSVFGKTQENLRNGVNVEVITKRDVALKRSCKPSFK